jgi:hypothetical protein
MGLGWVVRDGRFLWHNGAHQDATGAPKKAENKRLAVLAAVHRRSSTR